MILDKIKQFKVKKNSSYHIVALDIGTEFVKALVGKVENDKIQIVGVGRAQQGLSDMQAGAIADITAVVANCDKALTEAERMAGVDARECVIGIAGELVYGTTSSVKVKRAKGDSEISEKEIENIIKKVEQKTYHQAQHRLSLESGKRKMEVRLVNSALVDLEIDGYKVTNPVGFRGSEVMVQLYTAYAPMIHIAALERVASELDLDLIAVATEPFAVARSVVGDNANSTFSAVLVDVGGGTTDIAIVNEGGVEGTKMFGIGGRIFTRSIANDLEIDFEEAEKLKLSLSSGKPVRNKSGLLNSLSKTVEVWQSGVELALSEYDHLDNLPNKILLCGGGSSLEMLPDKLKHGDWHKSLPFTKNPKVQHINPEMVEGIIDKTDTIGDHTYITAMGLLRVGLDSTVVPQSDKLTMSERLNNILSI